MSFLYFGYWQSWPFLLPMVCEYFILASPNTLKSSGVYSEASVRRFISFLPQKATCTDASRSGSWSKWLSGRDTGGRDNVGSMSGFDTGRMLRVPADTAYLKAFWGSILRYCRYPLAVNKLRGYCPVLLYRQIHVGLVSQYFQCILAARNALDTPSVLGTGGATAVVVDKF